MGLFWICQWKFWVSKIWLWTSRSQIGCWGAGFGPIILWSNMGIILYCNHNVIVSYSTVIVLLRIQLEAYCNCILWNNQYLVEWGIAMHGMYESALALELFIFCMSYSYLLYSFLPPPSLPPHTSNLFLRFKLLHTPKVDFSSCILTIFW